MKKISQIIAKLAFNAAVSAAGSASDWCTYQPKEPEILKDFIK
jgi:cyclic lactone autoinducer peptide